MKYENFLKLFIKYGFIVSCTCILITFMAAPFTFNDPDTFWHIELGNYMLENKVILDEAIYTFAAEKLPYVPHEIAFQILIAFMFKIGGWNGVYLLNVIFIWFTIIGLFKMVEISKREYNMIGDNKKENQLIVFFLMFISTIIFYYYFNSRPQIVSTTIIVWFFVWLRRFQENPTTKKIAILSLLSFLLANFHTGTWIVVFVFTGMILIESLFKKTISLKHFLLILSISLVAIINPGGINTLFYFLAIETPDKYLLLEWQSLSFKDLKLYFVLLVTFIFFASSSIQKNVFRAIFALGIFYLGIQNFKLFLFILLFSPYFIVPAIYKLNIPFINKIPEVRKGLIYGITTIFLTLNVIFAFSTPYEEPKKEYPVEEINFILKHHKSNKRPNVIAEYAASGFLLFKGASVLADGRFDPFITEESKDKNGLTAFQRSTHLYDDILFETLDSEKVDYLILPTLKKDKKNKASLILTLQFEEKLRDKLGTPIFSGEYGDVWYLKKSRR